MCGLIGWIGDDPTKFTFSKLHTLGVLNEVRGKHSCGVSFDGEIWTGINKEKLWRDFGPSVKDLLDEYPLQNPVVIGHTRWASVAGDHNSDNAHPFGFGLSKEKDGFDFCGAHNGTISNIDELANKYGIEKVVGRKKDKRSKIDSEILLEIIYKKGISVLSEYEGGAALIWYNTNKPNTMYAYHGKSRMYPSSFVEVEERPLFFLQEDEGSIYISSLEDSLITINDTGGKIEAFEFNTVYEIVDGNIKDAKKIEIDRGKNSQKSAITVVHSSYGGYPNSRHNLWDDDSEMYPAAIYHGNNCGMPGLAGKQQIYNNPSAVNEKTEKEDEKKQSKTEIISLFDEKARGKLGEFQDVVYFNRLRYWCNGKVITGVYAPTKNNAMMYLADKPDKAREVYRKLNDSHKFSLEPILFYFYKGIALEKEIDYNITNRESNYPMRICGLSYMSKYPILDLLDKGSKIIKDGHNATDFFYPYLSKKVYTVSNGECVDIIDIDDETLYDDFKAGIHPADDLILKKIKPGYPRTEVFGRSAFIIKDSTETDNRVVSDAKDNIDAAIDDAMELIGDEVTNERTKEEALGLFQMIKDQFIQTFEKLWQR